MKSLGPGLAIGGDASESSFKQEQERERLEDQQVMRITGGQGGAQAPSLRQRSIRDINGIRIQMTKSQQGSSRLFELSKNVSSRLVVTRQSSEELRRKQNKIRKLILENDRSVQEELVQMRLASHHHSWTRIVMAALTLIITIMPLTAQEFFLEIMIAAFFNTSVLVFVQGHANYPEFFYPCAVALLLVPILNRLFRWWNKKRQKKKQQDGNAQGACDSPLPKGPSIRFWAKDEDFMDRSKEHSRTKSKSRAFSYLSPRRK
uniref:Uncharacterized protein n=1 Tax=Heterosigma akashiwo TaxID=2829 RepID=A0A7S3XXQ7_HETAK